MKNQFKCSRKQKYRQRGSLTLACCLMLPAITLLMISLLVGSSWTREDLDAIRAAKQSADSALAAFDRGLYRDFGLFALTDQEVNRTSSEYLLPDTFCQKITVKESLYDNDLLMGAIARHMSVRATAGLVDEAISRIRVIRDILPDKMADSVSSLVAADPDTISPDLEEDESNEEWFSEYSKYIDQEYREDYHDSLLALSPVYVPDASGSGTVEDFDPYKVSSLEKLAQGLDTMMFTLPEGFTDQILLSEYTLSYFGSQVNSLKQNGSTKQYRTPDGRLHSQFAESRQYEQEMIATGSTGEKAARNVKYFLTGFRILVNLLSTILSSDELALYDAKAAAISASVAVISLGFITIPPEAISAVLIISDSIAGGIKDKNKLLDGEEIKLWPSAGAEAFKVNYRDHLRLLILFQPKEKLLERISAAIKQNYGDEYFTAVSCEVTRPAYVVGKFSRRDFAITIERRYFSRKEKETQ
ncbi:MAG: hypothetical protein GX034_05200 [Clostridiaceae bacterium]|nr:hypothetical protein [Clostridiaceae bacterium]